MVTAEVNLPTWAKFVESIFPKVQKMALRPRHQTIGFPLLSYLLSVSRADFFHKNWMAVLDMCQTKFKDRLMRSEVLLCVTQLLWVYLFRHGENANQAQKRIGMLMKIIFPPGRRSLNPVEVPVEYFVTIITLVGVRYSTWCVSQIISALLSCEQSSESWASDRMLIAIESLSWLFDAWLDGVHRPPFPLAPITRRAPNGVTSTGPKIKDFVEQLSPLLHKILDTLHQMIGIFQLDDERYRIISYGKSLELGKSADEVDAYPVPIFLAAVPRDRMPYLEVLKAVINGAPRLIAQYDTDKLVDILCSYLCHVDRSLCDAALGALRRMVNASPGVYQLILLSLESRVMGSSDRHFDLLTNFAVRPDEAIAVEHGRRGILDIYAEFFQKGKSHTRQLPLDALCLALLCSPKVPVRKLALAILKESGSMVVHILTQLQLVSKVASAARRDIEEWSDQFRNFITYCVDFLPRDCIKRAVQIALERVTFLHSTISPADTGLLWTSVVRSPSEESILHWKRCGQFVVLGMKYLSSPREVFSTFVSLLTSDFANVRDAAIQVLASTCTSHQSLFFDEVLPLIQMVTEDLRLRAGRRFNQPKKPGKVDRLRLEIPRLLRHVRVFPPAIVGPVTSLCKGYKLLLGDQRNNPDLEHLRIAFANFIHYYYENDFDHAIEARTGMFELFLDWDEAEAKLAMLSLLRGPISFHPASVLGGVQVMDSSDMEKVLSWIETLLKHGDLYVSIAQKSLVNFLEFNSSTPQLYETIVRNCFSLNPADSLCRQYFLAFSTVFNGTSEQWTVNSNETVLVLGLVKLVDQSEEIRLAALEMITFLQDRAFLDLEIATVSNLIRQPILSSSSHAILVERLIRNHPSWTFPFLSECFSRLKISDYNMQEDLLLLISLGMKSVSFSNTEKVDITQCFERY
jgi:hypothetical protein